MLHYLRRSVASTIPTGTKLPSNPIPERTETSPSSTSPSQQRNETFTLPNDHTLGFSLCGPVDAPALFYFHGQGSSRLQGLAFAKDANKIGVHVICPDRPGIGLSTFDPGRKLLDYPQQIAQLARHLGLGTYRVMGGSGGGPYVLACAYALPRTQLKGAAVLAGIGPPEDASFSDMRLTTRMLFAGLRYAPSLVGAILDLAIGKKARNPDPEVMKKTVAGQMKYVDAMLTPSERQLFRGKPEFVEEIVEDFREHFRQGAKGFVRDGQLNVEPWGFRLEDVPFTGVRLYYGSEDTNTPARMGRNIAAKLKDAVFKEYEGETHMTLSENHGEEILRDVVKH